MSGDGRRLPGLDALRGIAALCVVGLHANAIYPHDLPKWFSKGYLGVDFFLMLSGYLVARITEPRLAAGATPVRFMLARYRRFWPVVALGSLIGIPFLWDRTGGDPLWFAAAFGANMVFLPWPADRLLYPLNVPVWTILAELLANALHVFVLWRLRTSWIVALVLASLAGTLWVALVLDWINVGARPSNYHYAPPRILLAYGMGILLWRLGGAGLRLPAPGWLALPLMPAAMLVSWASDYKAWPFDILFVTVLCPLVIVLALGSERDTRLERWSAAIAFPLFAAHVPAIEAAKFFGFGPLVGLAAALAATFAILWWTNRATRRMEPARTEET